MGVAMEVVTKTARHLATTIAVTYAWWVIYLPIAWIGMFTVLLLFCLGIGIALLTLLPFMSIFRLLIPAGDRRSQASSWFRALLRNGAWNWKPSSSSTDGEEPKLCHVELRRGRCRYVVDEACGDEKGTVVLLHGVSMTCDMWEQHAKELQRKGYRVVRFDFYGHGHSTCDPTLSYDLALFVEQTSDALEALCKDQRPALVGFSLGGLVAACFTAQHPTRVGRLCLVDSCGFAAPPLPLHCFPAYLCHGIFRGEGESDPAAVSALRGISPQGLRVCL